MAGSVQLRAEPGVRHRLAALAEKVEERLGLTRSGSREEDILKAAAVLARENNLSAADFLQNLLNLPPEVAFPEEFVSALTVGETYFFRERQFLEAFRTSVFAGITEGKKDRLRIWSAGCSSGEEAYTIAMLLLRDGLHGAGGDISILGTDINSAALEKARRGVYSSWSFRGMTEEETGLFFRKEGAGRYSVRDRFKKAVQFSRLNLADPEWHLWRDGGAPDAIFCRNVLIYFAEEKRNEVIKRFCELLPAGGLLVTSACETASFTFDGFVPFHYNGAVIYKKPGSAPRFAAELPALEPSYPFRDEEPKARGSEPYFTAPAEKTPEAGLGGAEISTREERARRLADGGRHGEALQELEKAADENGPSPGLYYLRSLICQETGNRREASAALRSALYLDPDFAMAHYALGVMALGEGRPAEADRCLRNAVEILASLPADCLPPGGDGHTAADLLKAAQQLRDGI
ncbi:MAG: CheR family methyltransferase [Aminivibrio sp.]|jgi:chemotaxis protein methyltransferase CheR